MIGSPIAADVFWETYEQDGFLRLRRRPGGDYEGTLLDFGTRKPVVFGSEKEISIDSASIASYDFSADDQFTRGPAENLGDTLRQLLLEPEMRQDQRPVRDQLGLVARLLRDALPVNHTFSTILRTKGLVKRYVGGHVSREETLQELSVLHPEAGDSLTRYASAVLDALDREWISAAAAARLFFANSISPEVPFHLVWRLVAEAVMDASVAERRGLDYLIALTPTPDEYAALQSSGDIRAVHAERSILIRALGRCPTNERVAGLLLETLANHPHDDLLVTMETIDAIGMHNDKSSIDSLVELLDRAEAARFRDHIERALQRLCSGDNLIPQAIHGLDPDSLSEQDLNVLRADDEEPSGALERLYWNRIASRLPRDRASWLARDCRSVFWETRLRRVLQARSEPIPADLVQVLKDDEVAVVRIAAERLPT